MAVAPLRRRAGMLEIKNKERKLKEELKARGEVAKEEPAVSPEEEKERIEMLKRIGVLKE